MGACALHGWLDAAAARWPDHSAVENPAGGEINYRELAELSDRVRDRLVALGVEPGDRVGIQLEKSIDAVASIFGVLKAGAAYVPVDPHGPIDRNGYILADCDVRVVVTEDRFADDLRSRLEAGGKRPPMLSLASAGDGHPLRAALDAAQAGGLAPPVASVTTGPDDLAYVLYTSGSTGRPKGVMLTHENAVSYVDWCSATFDPTDGDRFSSHAPLHFDLSILDVYLPLKHGATLVLIGHEIGKEPRGLAQLIAERRLSVWYSTPSILTMLAHHGDLGSHDYTSLRLVLFAGEVFPVKHFRALREHVPHPRYFNLYGPTETNVCTSYEVPSHVEADRTEPFPIGGTCSHLYSRVIGTDSREVAAGEEGELCIRGPGVTRGYWNLETQTAEAFSTDDAGESWYRTGDVVVENANGDFIFRGRRDRMVKKRGYRVELDEIEACLHAHPEIRRAAVVARSGEDGVTIHAFVAAKDGGRLSVIRLKKFCTERVPPYMVPDKFSFHPSLPSTSTDKVDYQALKNLD